ncbi:pyroglutamyl-peptidase [Arthrobacter pigmenti]|uniref:Pyroglutamyl-peptidase I n=1 Tax=Arthrobacter pigmenti TaxID=271432 RepID=A0A846RJZ3_9MICC|nr:pyroglutamyl-peptidase I [Arthrobacter pigmenti]NJC21990.1 pyroglutamyl-peptidase [Arthrobacter pigmenti]
MILITGFEPFGGETVNPSWEAAEHAASRLMAQDVPAVAVQLPCVFGQSIAVLRDALRTHRPELVLCVGQAGGRAEISLERIAINVDDARIPDNAGNQPVDEPVRKDGPAAYFSALPIKRSLLALHGAGIPAAVSQTAGTYVCNHVFYGLMDSLADGMAGTERARGGFIHVPFSSEQAAVHGTAGLPIEEMASALAIIALVSAEDAVDIPLPAGAEH